VRPNLGPVVEIATPKPRDEREFLELVYKSAGLHEGWVHAPQDRSEYDNYLRRISTPNHRGFIARDLASRSIVGVVNINDIRFGSMLSASLGYYGFATEKPPGAMTHAVALVVDHAFSELGLHRLEANIQPANARSRALVERLGFGLEGFSPRYLQIAGAWRDHERWAVLSEDW
jgi:[ribosomal protein S5]-alanine N-acetyltransferase